MSQHWFYTKDGKGSFGPVSAAELQALARSSQLLPTELVWKEGMSQWTAASRIKGLFANAEATPKAPEMPTAIPLESLPPALEVPKPVTLLEAAPEPPEPATPPSAALRNTFTTPPPVPAPAPPVTARIDSVWHYIERQQTFGPVSLTYLEQRVKSGLLKPADLVWREGEIDWVAAGKVLDVFPRTQSGPPPIPRGEEFATAAPKPSGKPYPADMPQTPNAQPVQYRAAHFKDLYMKFMLKYIAVLSVTMFTSLLPRSTPEQALIHLLPQLAGLILCVVLSGMFLYRAWAQLQDGQARTTPGKAVGFRFIPFFNFYWEFVAVKGLAEDIEQYARSRRITIEPIPTGLTLSYCILMIVVALLSGVMSLIHPILGNLIGIPLAALMLIVFKKIADASATIAEAKLAAAPAVAVDAADDGTVQNAAAFVTAVTAGFAVVEKIIDDGHA